MKRNLSACLFILLCFPALLVAQSADEILTSVRRVVESHHSVSYEAVGRWYWNEYDDTAVVRGSCTLVRVGSDRLFGGKMLIRLGDSITTFYDTRGLYVIESGAHVHTAYDVAKGQVWPIMGDLAERLVWNSFLKPSILSPGLGDISRRLVDTVIDATPAYHLVTYYPDEDGLERKIRHLYISINDTIPVMEWLTFEYGDDPQYQERWLISWGFDATKDMDLAEVLPPGDSLCAYHPSDDGEAWLQPRTPLRVGTTAPPVTGTLPGKQIRKDTVRFAGHVTLLLFWYADCIPCGDVAPLVDSLHGLYGPLGLRVLAVDAQDRIGSARKSFPEYLARHPFSYPLLMVTHHIPELFGVKSWPALFLVDANGIIRFSLADHRYDWFKVLEKRIRELL